jgi:hypothetical protein
MHAEFYEKHEYRRYMVQLLLYVAQFEPYIAMLEKESENADKFVRSAARVLCPSCEPHSRK